MAAPARLLLSGRDGPLHYGADGLGILGFDSGEKGRGVLTWTEPTRAQYVYGPILELWVALGAETGLGYPTRSAGPISRATPTDPSAGQSARFAKLVGTELTEPSAIVWKEDLGAHAVYGAIYGLWTLQETFLYPTDDEHDVSAEEAGTCTEGDRAQSFQTLNGEQESVICWNEQSGATIHQR